MHRLLPRLRAIIASAAALVVAGPASAAQQPAHAVAINASTSLVMQEFMVPTADPGVRLYVRNKHPADLHDFQPERTLLFVHGPSVMSPWSTPPLP